MSDELDIRGGGAVAVDTATLRAAARGFAGLAAELDDAVAIVGSAALRLLDLSSPSWEAAYAVEASHRRMADVADGARGIAEALRGAAAMYEIVELRAERSAVDAAGDEVALARIDRRLSALAADHPDAHWLAAVGAFTHRMTWPGGLAVQAPGVVGWIMPGSLLMAAPLAWSLQQAIGARGAGTIPATARLSGAAVPVVVAPLATPGWTGAALAGGTAITAKAAAPASLADAAARVPGGGDARVRVERYTMPDGSRQFALYVAGTQTVTPNTPEPFDMTSNVELYTGQRSASYDATLAALADAGAQPGDTVHAFGHSQGAMVAARVALEGGFDTQTLVSFGSPVEADIGDGTLSVSLRHDDDPVAALAAGGHAHAVGGPGSFVAERTADAMPGPHDLGMPAHGIDAYTHTAELLDASGDPRMHAVRSLFDELQGAASADVTEYSAVRAAEPHPQPVTPTAPVSPSCADAG